MGILQDGVWFGSDEDQIGARGWEPRQERLKGFVRARPGTSEELPAEAGRFHLIVCPGCPLSHRVAIVYGVKGLRGAVSMGLVRPVMGPNGREFGTVERPAPDPVTGAATLHELYTRTQARYSGRDSTPVLWDRSTGRIVSNAYRDILAIMNREFDAFATRSHDFQPPDRAGEIERDLAWLSNGLLGAVYKAGFSRDQATYEAQAALIDRTLPEIADRLSDRPFLLGDEMTEPDLALFAGLVRFDAIYVPLFRCTRCRVEDHPALTAYVRRILAIPGVRETFDLGLTMRHYFVSHAHINPTRIVPLSPRLSWHDSRHDLLAA